MKQLYPKLERLKRMHSSLGLIHGVSSGVQLMVMCVYIYTMNAMVIIGSVLNLKMRCVLVKAFLKTFDYIDDCCCNCSHENAFCN